MSIITSIKNFKKFEKNLVVILDITTIGRYNCVVTNDVTTNNITSI